MPETPKGVEPRRRRRDTLTDSPAAERVRSFLASLNDRASRRRLAKLVSPASASPPRVVERHEAKNEPPAEVALDGGRSLRFGAYGGPRRSIDVRDVSTDDQ